MKPLGILLIIVGVLIVVFSETIVFPGLERLVGIEIIVGEGNVYYNEPGNPDAGYCYTNPGAMIRWIAFVAFVGLLIAGTGGVCIFKSRAGITATPAENIA